MKRKILAVILSLVLVISLLPVAALAVYSDSQDHWAEEAIDKWSANGIIQGYDGKFRPEDPITRGELAIIIDRLMKYQTAAENTFTDLDQNYYTEAILKANAAGVITGYDGKVRPTDSITREEAVVMFCRAFGLRESSAETGFTDSASISQWARGSVNAMAARGFVHGWQGAFNPLASISRAEIVTVLDNAVAGFYTEEKEYTGDVSGIAIINAPDVVLKDMTIDGDLIIAEGVGSGDVTLQNVVVTGNTIVRGGGADSIHIVGGSQISNLIIEKTDSGQIRVVTSDGAAVEVVYVDDGNDDIILTGSFESVSITAGVGVKVVDAVIGNVKVTGENARIDIDAASSISTLSADAPVTVDNKGTITKAEVNVENVTITGNKPKDITYATGVAGDTDKDDTPGGGGFRDTTAPTLNSVAFTANGTALTGTVAGGFTLEADRNSETNYLIDFSGTTSSEALSGGPFALYLDKSALDEAKIAEITAYYETKSDPYKTYLLAALAGTNAFAYIKAGTGDTVKLLDGAQYTLDSKSISMVIPGNYPLGTYVLNGQIKDVAGNMTDLTYKLSVTVSAGTVWSDLADTAWYDPSATSFTLTTAEQLAGLAVLVNGGNNFTGKTVVLGYDIDLFGIEWIPIGIDTNDGLKAFAGTFNGNNKTVSNLVINTAYVGNAG
ncbi:MAG: S-layer homology domain-containing protein, partial [Clostridiales bacterium]|nr:S-layer homology domain-containing protein [Clostridiales bacterium]